MIRLRNLIILLLLCFSLQSVFGIKSASAKTGFDLQLEMPPTNMSRILPVPSYQGMYQSEKPVRMLDDTQIRPLISSSYDGNSGLLVFEQQNGHVIGHMIPATADVDTYTRERIKLSNEMVFRQDLDAARRARAQKSGGSLLEFEIPVRTPKFVKSIIGEGGAGLKINGYRKISFSGRSQWQDGTQVSSGQSKFPTLNMEQISRFQISGTIGSKIFVDVNQDSKRQQSLSNRIQLRYKGTEDDIIKNIELGNTNLALPSTRFIGYSQSVQGLFGVKADAQVGPLKLTAIASQEKSSNKSATFSAGSDASSRFIRDYNYLDNTYFWLDDPDSSFNLNPRDSIINLEVYAFYSTTQNQQVTTYNAKMYVDPDHPDRFPNENFKGTVALYGTEYQSTIDQQLYEYHPTEHYIIMDQPIRARAMGVWMQVQGPDGTIRTIGNRGGGDNDTLVLKLIIPESPRPENVTWSYVWRNVYDVGRIDDPDGFDVEIFRGQATSTLDQDASEVSNQRGDSYIHLLGIDKNNDGKVDSFDPNILDPYRGHLRLPDRYPFASDSLDQRVSAIYTSQNIQTRQDSSKYYLVVKSATRQDQFYLGQFDIVQNSETVTLNGRRLERDKDYQIYYESGQIRFLNQEALSANADVKVNYEYAPLITSEKKTLLGVRGEYQVAPNLKVGSTVLYKSEKQTDRKPRLGEEQSKFLNLDFDGSYSLQTMTPTKFINALPLIHSKATSRISIQGEVGKSAPNPNVNGEAYIDDFEGAVDRFAIGVQRTTWYQAAPPTQLDTLAAKHARLIWYNPYDQLPITDIYNRDLQASANSTSILTLRFSPVEETDAPAINSYNGITHPFSSGSYDQTKTKFIELRMRGEQGVVHVDLGEITEDINGDGVRQREDKNGNNLLDPGEDTGLDGLSDAQEKSACDDGTAPVWYDCDSDDPAGDDWSYSNENRNDYNHINGTEGNGGDQGGRLNKPDTEDINGTGGDDYANNYYTWTMDLANNPYLVEGSKNENGWYSVRIPFQDSTEYQEVGNPSRSLIKFMRIWIDGVASPADTIYVDFADIDLTRNLWESRPVLPEAKARPVDTRFEAAVINTESDKIYTPPPGVAGYYDKTTGTTETEQSLRLNFENFTPGDTGICEKVPFKQQDLSGYHSLEMYIHGDQDRDSLIVFMRFGPDADNYYEYRSTVREGWDQNNMLIDFDAITQLKLKLQAARDSISALIQELYNKGTPEDSATAAGLELPTEFEERPYRLRGSPSITRVKYYALGVINNDPEGTDTTMTGSVWIDELRVTKVRRDKGTAAFVAGSMTFGDVASISVNYQKTDAFFRTLTQADRRDLGSGSGNKTYGYSASFNAHKFLPESWGASLPISFNWSKSELTPRLMTGSDIVVPQNLIQQQMSVSTNTGFNTSLRFNSRSNNPVIKYFLNNLQSLQLSYNRSQSRSPTVPQQKSERYTAQGGYNLNVPSKGGLKIFSWLGGLPLVPDRVVNSLFNPMPNRLQLNAQVDRTLNDQTNNFGIRTFRYLRTFKGQLSTGVSPLSGLDLTYRMQTDRDISDPNLLKISFNPSDFKLGQERRYDQSFQANYAPNILPFITGTRLGFSSSHSETFSQSGSTISNIRRIGNSRSATANTTFNLQRLLGENKRGSVTRNRRVPPREPPKRNLNLDSLRQERDTTSQKKPEPPKEPGTPFYMYGLQFLRLFTDRINPIALGFKWDERASLDGYAERPSLAFRFGFSSDPGVKPVGTTSINQIDSRSRSRSYSAGSGVQLFLGMSVDTKWSYAVQEASNRSTRDENTVFPDLGFKFGKLDFLVLPKFFSRSFTLDSKYSKKESKKINVTTDLTSDLVTTIDYNPLIQSTIEWKFARGFRSTIGYSKSTIIREKFRAGEGESGDLSTKTIDYSKTITVRSSYSFRGGSRVWLPLFGRVNIQSNLSLDFDVSLRKSKSENYNPGQNVPPSLTAQRSDLTIQPQASYNFSQNIRGGLTARWTDTKDRSTGNRHTRELQFWVEIQF